MDQLTANLKKLEKQNYRAYQRIKGRYDFGDFTLFIDQMQADPYAPDSRVRALRPWPLTDLDWLREQSEDYQIAARDFIARSFEHFAKQENAINIMTTGQVVLDATSVLFTEEGIELRFTVDMPADGRQILAKRALNLLTFHLPKFIRRATIERELDKDAMIEHCELFEDQQSLRSQLAQHDLVAFVADGSVLPRLSGASDKPMKEAIEFVAPESLAVELTVPHKGAIRGLGIKKGITLIVGGGFHGKSTLLHAVERAIYNHIIGDGREYVVCDEQAMKIRAEDGRCVHNLNLSNYINHLPSGNETENFSTQDASGSTSQAAWLQESLEAGASTLLIDEDTSATNFMIRDERMQALVGKEQEPITPLVDRVVELSETLGVSTMIVMGGSGDYLDVADTVIQMHNYQALDVTENAQQVVATHPSQRTSENETVLKALPQREFDCSSLQALLAEGKFRITARDRHTLRFGKESTDLSALAQLESYSETNAIGWTWFQLAQQPGWSSNPVADVEKVLSGDWFDTLPKHVDAAKPRTLDVMAALNRMRKSRFRRAD